MNGNELLEKDRLKAADVWRRISSGLLDPVKGTRMVSRLADRHPLCPLFFTVLGSIEILCSGIDEDRPGYLSLARLKGRHLDPEPLYEALLETTPFILDVLIDTETHREEAGRSIYEYYGIGARARPGAHLLTHLLLQDLLERGEAFSGEQAGLYMSGRDALLPLLRGLESGLDMILSSEGRVPDLTRLYIVLGSYSAPETLPLMLKGLTWCTGQALNEAVLALVKTGYLHPREVTSAVRGMLDNGLAHEAMINAVDVIGLLGPLEGNYDFLAGLESKLDPRNPLHQEMLESAASSLGQSPGSRGRLESIAGEDAAAILSRPQKRFFFESEVIEGPRPWELTMTLRREIELDLRERSDAQPNLEGYWYYQEGWETFDEDLRDFELQRGLPHRYRRIMIKLMSYSRKPEFARDMSLALREWMSASGRKRLRRPDPFPGLSREEVAFYDWAFLSRSLDGRRHQLVREFLEENEQQLWDDEADYLKAMAESRLSLFEVLEAGPESPLRLRDAIFNDTFTVRDDPAFRSLEPSAAVIARLGETRSGWEVLGLPLPVHEDAVEWIGKAVMEPAQSRMKAGPDKDMVEYLREHALRLFFCRGDLFEGCS